MQKRLQITIYGKVQGVYFRVYTKKHAQSLGIKGFVKNQKNGSVYIEAFGNDKRLKEFIEWLKKGPDEANVKKIDIKELSIDDKNGKLEQILEDFHISR